MAAHEGGPDEEALRRAYNAHFKLLVSESPATKRNILELLAGARLGGPWPPLPGAGPLQLVFVPDVMRRLFPFVAHDSENGKRRATVSARAGSARAGSAQSAPGSGQRAACSDHGKRHAPCHLACVVAPLAQSACPAWVRDHTC